MSDANNCSGFNAYFCRTITLLTSFARHIDMKRRLLTFVKYYLYWVILFLLQKPLFMLYHHSLSSDIAIGEWGKVLSNGLDLDLSTAAYLTVIPGLCLTASCLIRRYDILKKFVSIYHFVLLIIISLIFCVDLELYSVWGFRIDNTIFFYLQTPKDAAASLTPSLVLVECLLFALCVAVSYFCYKRLFKHDFESYPPSSLKGGMGLLLCTALLFVPIRGGFTVSTMNVGKAYFSNNMFLNHAAINPTFNFMQSLFGRKIDVKKYTYMPTEEADRLFHSLYSGKGEPDTCLLRNQRPNIILIILESFSSSITAPLGGLPNVAPNLNQLCQEGILFSQMYASSFRTDRGLVSILSGYPAQPTTSIMKYPSKSQTLPTFSKRLAEEGYHLKFYYGGDEDFTNMRSYFISAGFNERISDKDFTYSERSSKWGAHDHLVFHRLLDDLDKMPSEPFMKTLLTLSSHEPFEVPSSKRFDHPYLNSVAYTDSCLGAFIDEFKQSPLWDNTLIILTPDHAMKYPDTLSNHLPERYKIPVLWLGGAIKGAMEVNTLGSQIDIAPTLLAQMGLSTHDFTFGKDLFDQQIQPFAFYSFIDGFGMITPESKVVFDCKAQRSIVQEGEKSHTKHNEETGKAFLQTLYHDLNNR